MGRPPRRGNGAKMAAAPQGPPAPRSPPRALQRRLHRAFPRCRLAPPTTTPRLQGGGQSERPPSAAATNRCAGTVGGGRPIAAGARPAGPARWPESGVRCRHLGEGRWRVAAILGGSGRGGNLPRQGGARGRTGGTGRGLGGTGRTGRGPHRPHLPNKAPRDSSSPPPASTLGGSLLHPQHGGARKGRSKGAWPRGWAWSAPAPSHEGPTVGGGRGGPAFHRLGEGDDIIGVTTPPLVMSPLLLMMSSSGFPLPCPDDIINR